MKRNVIFFLILFIANSCNSQTLYFPPIVGTNWDTMSPASLNWCPNAIDSLYAYLDTNNTKAFILLKDGKIVLEKYFGTHTQNSLWQWASAGKTITSFLTGMAQEEGYLDIDDSTSSYLGNGWTACTPLQEAQIKIRNQLSMTSGLDDDVLDPYCTLDTCLQFKAASGTRWAYHNGPYTLLDGVIENACGMTLNAYNNQKLKIPTGMSGTFVNVGYNNVYFSNARSMARFGLLLLNKGIWNGTTIMTDTSYFNQMISTSQPLNLSYGYLWWLNGKASYMVPGTQFVFSGSMNPNAPADMIAAIGKDGQFLNVVPSSNMVWIRMGESPDALPVPFLLNDNIWKYINKLPCISSDIPSIEENVAWNIYANAASNQLHINTTRAIQSLTCYSMLGQLQFQVQPTQMDFSVPIHQDLRGMYIFKAIFDTGEERSKRIILD